MQQPTYNALPEDVKEAVTGLVSIDPTVPDGQVKDLQTGAVIPVTQFVRRIRAKRKTERQNRKRGRARR